MGGMVPPNGVLGGRGIAGIGGIGGFNGMGGMGGMGGTPSELPKNPVTVVIEANKVTALVHALSRTPFVEIKHKWGETIVVESDLVKIKLRNIPTVLSQYKAKRNLVEKHKTDKKQWLDLAGWVLRHGLVAKFPGIMAEVEKLDPKDPAVLAFKKLEAAWKTLPTSDEPSAAWAKDRLTGKRYEPKSSAHYTLLTTSADKDEVKQQLQRLEDAYHSFFYWFALQGTALQVPKHRLVVALIGNPADFTDQRRTFDSVPMVADGFTVPRDNVVIVSARPRDELYFELDKINQENWQEHSRKELLKPSKKVPPVKKANQGVFTLVQTALEEQSAQATISHEATLQLLAAAGQPAKEGSKTWVPVLARNLQGPEWTRFGLASFFETPYGAYWPGATAPSWRYFVQFKFADEEKKFANAEEVLEKVITDQYFREAQAGRGKERKAKLEFARTTSWALAYYLAEKEPDKLLAYLTNLSKLPRNMEFDKAVLKDLFIKSVLESPSGFKRFANHWLYTMREKVSLDVPQVWTDAKKAREAAAEADKKKKEEEAKPPPNGPRPPFGPPPSGGERRGGN
jgi:hypothetical protein